MRVTKNKVVLNDLPIDSELWQSIEAAARRDSRPVEHIIIVALQQYIERRTQ